MEHIFLLSGDYIVLGREEVFSLFKIRGNKLTDRLLVVDLNGELDAKLIKRLALTKNIYRLLFECKPDGLIGSLKRFDWNSVYKKDFCVRTFFIDENKDELVKKYSESKLANFIWDNIKSPKVNFRNPKTLITVFISKDKSVCGVQEFENRQDFESRKAHRRPFPHPSSLHPKVARALVNISEIKENEILLDPFCGTGGFLIEAGLMKIKSVGYDINKIMTKGCRENLQYFKISSKIKTKNALDLEDKFDCVVTDLPYGLNSNAKTGYEKDWKKFRLNRKIQKEGFTEGLEKFYLDFLKNLRAKLKKKAVIIFPSYVNYRKILRTAGFRIEKEFSNYVHRSLTRKIVKIS